VSLGRIDLQSAGFPSKSRLGASKDPDNADGSIAPVKPTL
jgi:hypothetical protein